MTLPQFATRRRVTVTMIFVAVLIFGIISLINLNIDILPDIEPPAISVITFYPGANATDVESEVTTYIEDELSTVNNLDRLTSLSKDNLSVVTCRFTWGADLDVASNDVRDRLDLAKPRFPKDVQEPLIFKFSTSAFPVLILGVHARESYPQLYQIVDKRIADPLKRVEGVGAVIISGGLERQINVFLHRERLEAYHLPVEAIMGILAAENVSLPAGGLKMGRRDYHIRVPARFEDVEEIKGVVVGNDEGRLVYLRDVADVEEGFKEDIQRGWVDNEPAIALYIQKQSGVNTVRVVEGAMRRLEEIKPTLPADVQMSVIIDTARDIKISVANLATTVWWGGLLVVLITFIFLRRGRSSLIISLTIPFSLVISFVFLYLFGYTINIMSLMSLAIAIGMVVDNAIVVLENITHHLEVGSRVEEASVVGAQEVGLAISVSTLTTVVVFAPMVFVGGIVGVLFKQLAFVVAITLLASLFTSLTLTPMLSSVLLRGQGLVERVHGRWGKWLARSDEYFKALEAFYRRVLNWALTRRRQVLVATGVVLLVSLGTGKLWVGTEFFPDVDSGEIQINLHLPEGTRLEKTAQVAEEVMAIFDKEVPEREHYYAMVGQSREGVDSALGFEEGTNIAQVGAKLISKEDRKRSVKEIAQTLRGRFAEIPGIVRTSVRDIGAVQKIFFGGGGKKISLEILGYDLTVLNHIAQEVKDLVAQISGTVDITVSRREPRPELWIKVDRQKASSLGLNMATITQTLRTNLFGSDPTQFRDAGEDYDIFLRLREEDRVNIEDIREVPIASPSGTMIRLKNVADVVESEGLVQIERKNRQRMLKVEADLQGRSLGAVTRDIKERLKTLSLPPGTTIEFGGDVEEQRKAFRDLSLMLLLGIALVYMVMASQFESLRQPLVIMGSVPFAFVGVIWSLLVTGTNLNVASFIGLIMLMGIVVNNAIVLVDYTNLLRGNGLPLAEAIGTAGARRLRPVLMTTLTTIFGLLPMAMSNQEGAETWNPLGITVIGGLLVSSIVTLIIIPVLYSLVEERLLKK